LGSLELDFHFRLVSDATRLRAIEVIVYFSIVQPLNSTLFFYESAIRVDTHLLTES